MTNAIPFRKMNGLGNDFVVLDLRARSLDLGPGEIRAIADRSYEVEFPHRIPLSERVLYPSMGAEQVGMEDARFVRFIDDDGSQTFYATYTAYSGSHISQQLLETTDFLSFTSAPTWNSVTCGGSMSWAWPATGGAPTARRPV